MFWQRVLTWIALTLIRVGYTSVSLDISINDETKTFTVDDPYSQFQCPNIEKYDGTESYCKYYGECCGDVVRIRERLEAGTFQCMTIGHTAGYMVNQCPQGTSSKLSQLCANSQNTNELGIGSWPVTGSYTGITYTNFYCALCNGAVQPVLGENSPITFDSQKSLEFWYRDIVCTNETVQNIKENNVTVDSKTLQSYVNDRKCWTVKYPTNKDIHGSFCTSRIVDCPEDYTNTEIRALCRYGPYQLVNEFRNQFCEECWKGNDITVSRTAFNDEAIMNDTLLVTIKPVTQNHTDHLSDDSYKNFTLIPPDVYFSLTNNITNQHTFRVSDGRSFSDEGNDEDSLEFWDLGSLLCRSNYSTVCGEFAVFPAEGDDGVECSGAGCGTNQIQDLTNSCTGLDSYDYDQSLRINRKFNWTFSLVGDYFSTCSDRKKVTNCNCDPRCHYFGDCCSDADPPTTLPTHRLKWTCHNLYPDSYPTGMVIVDACPDSALPAEHRLCDAGTIGEWNSHSWLVTDTKTNITYKNFDCAKCNGASDDLSYWDVYLRCQSDQLGNIIGACDFSSYAPELDREEFFYACSLEEVYISTCPKSYANWRLSEDCETAAVSYVYYEHMTFRNYFCAICNLGDSIADVRLQPSQSPVHSQFLTNHNPSLIPSGRINYVRFSYMERKCCGGCLFAPATCPPISAVPASWGKSVNMDRRSCVATPFNTTCETDIADTSLMFPSDFSIERVCGSRVVTCMQTTTTTIDPRIGRAGKSGISPSFSFDGASEISERVVDIPEIHHSSIQINPVFNPFFDSPKILVTINKTVWLPTNDSFQLCSNRSIISITSEKAYRKILLSPSGIQVKEVVVITEERYLKLELAVHDYVLIAVSLTAIVFYIIYLLIKKRRRLHLADYMMIALLFSLSGALICFSVLSIPAGKDLVGCQVLAAITQFFFLASLTWSNSLAISIVRCLHTMRLASRSSKPLIFYSFYSFGFPILCVTLTYIVSRKDIVKLEKNVYGADSVCFIDEPITLLSLFVVPIYILIVINIVIGIIVMSRIARSGGIGARRDKDRIKRNVIACFKISFCLGLGWVLLIFATFYDSLYIAVQVFVELQGFLIVFSNMIGWSCLNTIRSSFYSVTQTSSDVSKTNKTAVSTADQPTRETNL